MIRKNFLKAGLLPLVGVLVVMAFLPVLLPVYWVTIAIRALWIMYICVAWNILASSNTYSLAHALFIGAGAYASTYLFLSFGISPWLGMLVGCAVAVALSSGIGWLCFRHDLPQLSFFVITIAFSFIGLFVVKSVSALGSVHGLYIRITADDPLQFQWLGKTPYYYIILGMVVGAVVLSQLIFRSRFGISLRAIGKSPRVAAAFGIDVVKYKMVALAVSAAMCAMAGTFWAQYSTYIDPDSIMHPLIMFNILLFVVVGGAGTLLGPVIAPAVLVPLGEYLRSKLNEPRLAEVSTMVWAAIILAVIFSLRKGMVPWLEDRIHKRRAVRRKMSRSVNGSSPTDN